MGSSAKHIHRRRYEGRWDMNDEFQFYGDAHLRFYVYFLHSYDCVTKTLGDERSFRIVRKDGVQSRLVAVPAGVIEYTGGVRRGA
jgi:hypothetical protein